MQTIAWRMLVLFLVMSARADTQPTIPLRKTAPPSATTTVPLGAVLNMYHLPGGKVLVNDAGNLRVLLFDANLANPTTIADTLGKGAVEYGPNPTPLLAYIGDSTLLLDRRISSARVLDPSGRAVRTTALPKVADTPFIWGGRVMTDPAGRLVYRGAPRTTPAKDSGQTVYINHPADSAPIVRANFDTRTVDTIGRVKLPLLQEAHRRRLGDGTFSTTVYMFGLSWIDDWVLTSDGALAIVRGQDYHIDWVLPDGRQVSTPKMPIDWKPIDEMEKKRLADSAALEVKTWFEERRAAQRAARGNTGLEIVARADLLTGTLQILPYNSTIEPAPPNRVPDYTPPVRAGSVKADRAGNVWILPATSAQSRTGALVYDVVNRNGIVVERVEMPSGRSIAEFGPNGTIYLMFKDAEGAWHIERTRAVNR